MPDVNLQEPQKLSEAIARPPIRKVFVENPFAALEQAGVNANAKVTYTPLSGDSFPRRANSIYGVVWPRISLDSK